MSKEQRKNRAPSRSFSKDLEQRQNEMLRVPARAAEYLMNAIESGDEADIRAALADIVRARQVATVARAAGIHRTTLHRMLQPNSRTTFSSMLKVIRACDLNISIAA